MVQPISFDDVADLYDAYVTADFDLPFFLEEARRAGGRVLELASGTGRVSLPLLQAGIDLTCIDYSAGMLTVLRQKLERQGLRSRIVHADVAEFDLHDEFDLILFPFHSFSEILTRERQESALRCIGAHLTERGRFVCTLQNPVVRTATMDGSMQTIGEFSLEHGGVLAVRSTLHYDASTHIGSGRQEYEVRDPGGRMVSERLLRVAFYLFGEDEFRRLAMETGFTVESLFGNYDRSPFDAAKSPFMIWTLTRQRAHLFP